MRKSLLGLFIISIFFVGMSSFAAGVESGDTPIAGDNAQAQIQAQVQKSYRFRARTRMRINSSVDVDVKMDVDAMKVGDQTFDIQITSADGPVELNMTCEENEAELGIQSRKNIRNRNRNRIRENFAIKLQSNISVNAKLGLEMSESEGKRSEWAYYDESTEEWVPVDSKYKNGMVTAETDHFSIWTVTTSEATIPFSLVGVMIFGLISVAAVFLYSKKKVSRI